MSFTVTNPRKQSILLNIQSAIHMMFILIIISEDTADTIRDIEPIAISDIMILIRITLTVTIKLKKTCTHTITTTISKKQKRRKNQANPNLPKESQEIRTDRSIPFQLDWPPL